MLMTMLMTVCCSMHPLQRERVWDATEIYMSELIDHADEAKDIYMRKNMNDSDMYRVLSEVQFYARVIDDLQFRLRESECEK